MRIGEFAIFTGTNASAVRYYEQNRAVACAEAYREQSETLWSGGYSAAWIHPALPCVRVLTETSSSIRKDCSDGWWRDGSVPENRSCSADVGQGANRRNEDGGKAARGTNRRSNRYRRVDDHPLFKIGGACIAGFSDNCCWLRSSPPVIAKLVRRRAGMLAEEAGKMRRVGKR